jgi:hypothetical protein
MCSRGVMLPKSARRVHLLGGVGVPGRSGGLGRRGPNGMLCWRWVAQRVDRLEHLRLRGRVGGGAAGEGDAVGAAGLEQRGGVEVAGGLLMSGAEGEGAELDGGDAVGRGGPDRGGRLAVGQQLPAAAELPKRQVALLVQQGDGAGLTRFLCDIDRFKAYNDSHGHPATRHCGR